MLHPDQSRAHLGKWLGSKDPAHISRWVSALSAGFARAPRCEAIATGTGMPCRSCARRGQRYCKNHIRGREAAAADLELAERGLKVVNNPRLRSYSRRRAERSLSRIARHEIYRSWKIDPRGPTVDLLVLSPVDERRVADWLQERHGIDLKRPLPGSTRPATARCRDRLRWAAWRAISRGDLCTPEFMQKEHLRVAAALRDDGRFWAKVGEAP